MTIPYTPQENGVAERANCTIMESVRCLLYQSSLPLYLWAEAVSTAVLMKNVSPSSYLQDMTPYERWWNQKPDVSNLRIFGCIAYVHVPAEKRTKLDKKSVKCIMIGYCAESKGYKLFDPIARKILKSRDVEFNELKNYSDFSASKVDVDDYKPEYLLPDLRLPEIENTHVPLPVTVPVTVPVENEIDQPVVVNDDELNGVSENNPDTVCDNDPVVYNRPQRQRTVPVRYGWEQASAAIGSSDPKNYSEAMKSVNADEWKNATDSEMNSLMKNDTWEHGQYRYGQI